MESMGVSLAIFIVIVVAGVLLALTAWLLKALTLRCACDLWSVDPSPGYLRCLLVTTILWPFLLAAMAGAVVGAMFLTAAFKPSPDNVVLLSVIFVSCMFLPVSAVISIVTFVLAFRANRVGIVKGSVVWLLDTLLYGLICAVLALLVVGSITVIQSVTQAVHIFF